MSDAARTRLRLTLALCVCLAGRICGQETISLDLNAALRMAAESNLAVQQGELMPAIARQRIREEGGRFDPVLDLSGAHAVDTNAQPLDPFGSRPAASELRSDDYEGGVRGLLPTGATYRAGLSVRNQRGTFNSFADNYYTFLGVSVSQPLLRNAGFGATLAPLRLARVDGDAAKWQFRQIVNDTLTATALAFHELVRAREALRVTERSVGLVERLVLDNEKRHSRGAMSAQDVVEARARAARRREGAILAQLTVSETENRLKRLIYPDFKAASSVEIVTRPGTPSVPDAGEIHRLIEAAFAIRPDFQQALLSVERRKIQLGLERSRVLPSVDLVASYGFNGNDATFGDSFSQARDGSDDSYSIGAIVSMPVPNRAASARKRVAALELKRAELALEDFRQEVWVQLTDAVARIKAARDRMSATTEARALAAQSLEAEEKRLRAGTSTTFLVLEQQEILAESELRELTAVSALETALADFNRLAGRTIDAYGLDPRIAEPVQNR